MDEKRAFEVRQAVCEAGKKMYHSGLVAGTWGNISMRVDDDYMVVTPSGMNYDSLNPEDMVLMNMHDFSYTGNRKPSIEYAMHALLLLDHKEANGVVHTHSTYALSVATAGKDIPPICDDQVQILGGDIKVTKRAMPGSREMADEVVRCMKNRAGCLVLNHGAVTIGRTLDEALLASVVLEKAAQVYALCQPMGGPCVIDDKSVNDMHQFFLNKYGQR